MNRAERRRQGIQAAKEPVYQVKQSDLLKIKENSTLEAIDAVMVMLLSIPVKVMHDKYGWGMKKRLREFAEAIIDEYQRFSDGEMSLEDYRQMVYEYCGVKFQKTERA